MTTRILTDKDVQVRPPDPQASTTHPSAWDLSGTTREDMAHRQLATALAHVRSAEDTAEKALDMLEAAIREQREVNHIDVIPELSQGFESMWQARRVRLLAEREQT